jgi:thiamine biosynthesis lipoprotein
MGLRLTSKENSASGSLPPGSRSPGAPHSPAVRRRAAEPEPGTPSETFRVMNTTVTVEGATGLEPWFKEAEATLSRFDPDSPLSQLNRSPGRWVVVPPLLFEAILLAIEAAERTGGAFDPTILDALEAAGYSRSFELGPLAIGQPVPAGRWREVQTIPGASAVWLPPGVRLDLGGIGKGLAVDHAMARLEGVPDLVVNAGGDLAVRTRPGAQPVEVEVADPLHPERTLVTFGLYGGSVATSSTLGRRWGPDLHHIIDPMTGRPARSGIVAATVVADRTAWAEILAKSCIVLGRDRGLALLAKQGCPGFLVAEDGTVIPTPGMEAYLYGRTQN